MAEPCPRCGVPDVAGDACPQCGVKVQVFRASLEKMRRGPVATAPPSAGAPPPDARGASPPPAVRTVVFHGTGPGLFGIQAVNALLTLLTLGVFYFWGKTRVRRYVWGETELDGDRFAYHGDGRELLMGFVRGAAIFFIPIGLLAILPELYQAPGEVKAALQRLLYLVGLLLVPIAMVGARRYRLSRTSWRGIRFSFRGRVREFIGIFVVGTILTSVTLGFYYPVFVTQRQAFMMGNAYFGSRQFDFDGRGRDLLKPFVVMVLLLIPTLGLSWFWFSARRQRYFTEHTRFGVTRFRSRVTGGRLAWLTITNVLAVVLTLGLAWPWTVVRGMRFTFRYLTLHGPLDIADVHQDTRAASATGEGLAGLLDADFGVS
ncbi:MAG TPA: YjgN family protein [Methylomirabilota bacterium]|nr:YjgN family protein [Methylomirabilota bacterium]